MQKRGTIRTTSSVTGKGWDHQNNVFCHWKRVGPSEQRLLSLEKYKEPTRNLYLNFCSSYNVHTPLRSLQRWYVKCRKCDILQIHYSLWSINSLSVLYTDNPHREDNPPCALAIMSLHPKCPYFEQMKNIISKFHIIEQMA